jgi:hypothetical protein
MDYLHLMKQEMSMRKVNQEEITQVVLKLLGGSHPGPRTMKLHFRVPKLLKWVIQVQN